MEHLRNLVKYFKDKENARDIPRATEDLFVHLEETLLPHLLQVIKKDNELFTGPEAVSLFPGVDMRALWDGSDEAWSKVHMALVYSVLHGDPKEKFDKILEAVKGVLPGAGEQADEISRLLEDENTQSSLKDILDLVMSTRLASFVGDVIQSVKYDDLDLNIEDPETLVAMMRDPTSNATLNTLMERAKAIMEDRVRTGRINQQELIREIEMIRARLQSDFGRYLNETLIGTAGNTSGNTSRQIMANTPEARRARMIARLQKKQREKLGK